MPKAMKWLEATSENAKMYQLVTDPDGDDADLSIEILEFTGDLLGGKVSLDYKPHLQENDEVPASVSFTCPSVKAAKTLAGYLRRMEGYGSADMEDLREEYENEIERKEALILKYQKTLKELNPQSASVPDAEVATKPAPVPEAILEPEVPPSAGRYPKAPAVLGLVIIALLVMLAASMRGARQPGRSPDTTMQEMCEANGVAERVAYGEWRVVDDRDRSTPLTGKRYDMLNRTLHRLYQRTGDREISLDYLGLCRQ